MAGRSKIVDDGEVVRWIETGKTYQWMKEEYLRKYQLDVSIGMFSNFRSRHGLDGRIVRDEELIPWLIKAEHRYAHDPQMLRAEARKRAGAELTPPIAKMHEAWRRGLEEEGTVVHYDPDTQQGWFRVPAREGIDTDLIRKPDRKTTVRPSQ